MSTDADRHAVHIIFPLEVEDGWPPVSAERVWALALGEQLFQIDNIPWFVRGLASGDIVRAVAPSPEEHPVFVERVRWGGGLTIRVVPLRGGRLAGDKQAVLDRFLPLGTDGEGAGVYPIVALHVPPGADPGPIKTLLHRGVTDGWWEFEEGCVTDEWIAL